MRNVRKSVEAVRGKRDLFSVGREWESQHTAQNLKENAREQIEGAYYYDINRMFYAVCELPS
jgi:hypothetical protein